MSDTAETPLETTEGVSADEAAPLDADQTASVESVDDGDPDPDHGSDDSDPTEPAADAESHLEVDGEVDAAVDGDVADEAAVAGRPADRVKQLEAEGDIAADYLEELLDIADLDGDLDMDVEGDRAAVSIVGAGLDALVGDDGQVLEALQELTRLAVYRETGERSRLMLDIGGYRDDIRKSLVALAEDALEEVRETNEAVKLAPMTPFERKIVHDAVAAAGLHSESEGVEPTRCVVILPAG
jgi:spoIIIJ-associated protein